MVPPPADATRDRLLEVAGPLFAAKGFRDTGVKELCDAADCNVASINYHFGSKQDFYAAVLANAHRRAFSGSPMPEVPAGTAPEVEFATWLRWWISSMLHPNNPVWFQTLMTREMVDPTPALDTMVERSIRPMHARLTAIVRNLLPEGTPVGTLRHCTTSVLGQVLVYKHAAPVLQRLGSMPAQSTASLQQLADHIISFSLAGIAAVSATKASSSTPSRRKR